MSSGKDSRTHRATCSKDIERTLVAKQEIAQHVDIFLFRFVNDFVNPLHLGRI